MGRKVTVAACTLNQWALDFDGNRDRIVESIIEAKKAGAKLRIGGELEVTGYSCADHFLESDVFLHSIQVLADILRRPECHDIISFIGMPIMHKNVGYNCMVAILDSKILLIRPKQVLCDERNYRESRWFVPWQKTRETEDYYLPRSLQDVTSQVSVPFGDAVISTSDTCIGCEICEELWTADNPFTWMSLDGVEIIVNASASHHELRKSQYRSHNLIMNAGKKHGGIYVFANLRGGDGDRLYFDGGALITCNGDPFAQGKQFSLSEVEVTVATMDLVDVRTYRNQLRSRSLRAASSEPYPRVHTDFALSSQTSFEFPSCRQIKITYHTPEEEIALGPACWLWDYLRRSGQHGFFLPLSGGRDSAAVACIVFSMCTLVCNALKEDKRVVSDLRKVLCKTGSKVPQSAQQMCKKLLWTCFMSSKNTSEDSRQRASDLAEQIGSNHIEISIDDVVSAATGTFIQCFGENAAPRFAKYGGTQCENLALQNLQARSRMILAYFFAQLVPWHAGLKGCRSLLVLGTANVDESLRGYFTKYDCSSADLNPIGSISKRDLGKFLEYCSFEYSLSSLTSVLNAEPTAELEPLSDDGRTLQLDEVDMGMTYNELSIYGTLRKPNACGPYSMFCKLLELWGDKLTPRQIATKVKHFFVSYAINRHKMTVLTPAYHAETYSPDDHRHDHRPFLYNVAWPWQFREIDKHVDLLEGTKDVD